MAICPPCKRPAYRDWLVNLFPVGSVPMELSQNLKALLQEIGESSVILQLSMRLHNNPKWRVFRNYTEAGCDIVIVGASQQIKIEVKTRQGVITKRKRKDVMHFTVTKGERNSAAFVVCYWFDRAQYFVVPVQALKPIGKKPTYKFIPYILKSTGEFDGYSRPYLEAWELITDKLK